MKTIQYVVAATLICASGVALADYSGSREDRMQSALNDYHKTHPGQGNGASQSSGSTGTIARAEESVKRGAHTAGQAIKHGAQKVGHAVSTGFHKTGHALGSAGQKLKAKAGTPPPAHIGQKSGEQ